MATESVIWTALPNGFRDGGNALGFTIFVSPRLTADGDSEPLSVFPAFSNWPAALDRC